MSEPNGKSKSLGIEKETEIGIEAGKEVVCKTIQAFEDAGFTDCKIARELAMIAFSDVANHVEIAEGGELRFKTFKEQGRKRRAIKKIREKTIITESKDGTQISKVSTVEFELYDKLDALQKAIVIKGIQKPLGVKVEGIEDILRALHDKRGNR